MNSRSPRVVSKRRMPTPRRRPGERTPRPSSARAAAQITMKKIAVGQVHAIHAKIAFTSDPPQGEALGDVVAHEVDHERAGDDASARRRRRAGPSPCRRRDTVRVIDRGDRLGVDRGQGRGEQQLDPGEHEAEEGGDADAGGDQRHEDLGRRSAGTSSRRYRRSRRSPSARRDMKPSRIHTASGTLKRQWASATAMWVSNRPTAE